MDLAQLDPTKIMGMKILARRCLRPINHSAVDECSRNPGHGRERTPKRSGEWRNPFSERHRGRSLQHGESFTKSRQLLRENCIPRVAMTSARYSGLG
uniref:Uncharacterized protein n=1 Tax=Candidatus Kentrum sp. FW TaxID=2126338 RepID=A0A450TF84_9GAMM|nr:MAG: hypothetical protein BECKFW1821A_GA0114235_11075 [Candidatus Kentron sp. FW]VFJ65804.1 MAG: hypothetical protein BECKFW1821B_GA0114236_11076 [Candidatus Kentron sp. FW]